MEHLVNMAPWMVALLVWTVFSRVLFDDWADLLDCFRSWISGILKRIPFCHRLPTRSELRASSEHLKLALLAGCGLIAGMICRALLLEAAR